MTSSVESPSSSTTPDRSVDAAVGCALVGVVFDASNPFEADLVDAL
ncbi:MAG TPA: LacI family transcriptional regulator, partial [Gordonia polyisoprenivorans]|nr:LacI family transcriptional regulator [Gordonia polyisoprenivorans]